MHRGSSCGLWPRVLGQAVLCAAVLVGCTGHGKHTQAQLNLAQQRMAEMKSATEYQMGYQAYLAGDLDKALKHAQYSVELNPKIAKTHVLKGRILLEMSRINDAAAALREAQSIDIANVDSWYYLGVLAERIDRKDDALANYSKANELDVSNPQYAIAAAEMLIGLGRTDEAEAFLASRREHFQHSAGVRQTLGHIAMLKNDPAAAATLFGDARLLAPDDQSILEDLIRAQIATAQFGQAEANLARLLTSKDNKDRRDLLHMRARCLLQVERPVEARDILLALTKDAHGASDVEAWIALGQVSATLRDAPRLKLCAARVCALAPARPEGYVLRGISARLAKNYEAAEAGFVQAIKIDPSCENYVLLGLVLQDQNKLEQARASFEAAVKANPADESATKLLAAFSDAR